MSRWTGLVDKARSVFGRSAPATPVVAERTDAVARDYLDEITWQETLRLAPQLGTLVEDLSEHYGHAADFVADIFSGCIQGDPVGNLRLKAELTPSYRPYRDLVSELIDTPEMAELRTLSEYDQYDAALATLSMAPKIEGVLARFKEAEQKAQEAAQKQQQAQQQAEAARQAAEALQQALDSPPAPADPDDPDSQPDPADQEAFDNLCDGLGGQLQAALDGAAQAQAEADAADQDADAATQQAIRASRQELREAVEEADDGRQQEAELFEAFGVGRGELQQMSFEERQEKANLLSRSHLAEYRDLIGSMRTQSKSDRKKKVQHSPSEVFSVEVSGNFDRLIPAEMVNMAVPELEDDFFKRLVQEELLTYKLRGTEKLGKGPVIVVADESGTMCRGDMANHATREAWAKAVTLALLDGARDGARDFVYLGFASTHEITEHRFPKGRGELVDVIAMVEHFFNGGTAFMPPLRKAAEIIDAEFMEHGYSKADVVFITDGQAPVNPEFVAQWTAIKDKAQFRCFGIVVGTDVNTTTVEALSDNTRQITATNSTPEYMSDLFQVI